MKLEESQTLCQLFPEPDGLGAYLQRRRGYHDVHQWAASHPLLLQALGEARSHQDEGHPLPQPEVYPNRECDPKQLTLIQGRG